MDTNKEKMLFAALFFSINTVICTISYLGFFGIGIAYYSPVTDTVDVYSYYEMFQVFVISFVMHWINVLLIFYTWYKWSHTTIEEELKTTRSDYGISQQNNRF